jgi:predicted Zn-dependent protease
VHHFVTRLAVAATALVVACEPAPSSPRDTLPSGVKRRIATLEGLPQPTPEEVVELATLLREHGLLLEAADRLEAARRGGIDVADLHAGLAETYLELGYNRAVLRELNACLRQNPRQADCLEVFGRVLERDGSPGALQEARRVYTVFLEIAPDHPKAKRARSALDQLGGPLSRDELERAASAPATPPAAPGAGPAGIPGHGGAASPAHPGGAPPADSGGTPGLNAFGQALADAFRAMRRQAPAEAEVAFRRALALKPDHPATRAGLAEALAAQGKVPAAVEVIEAVWADAPGDPQVRLVFGSVMLQAGERRDEAVAAWESLVRDAPQVAQQYQISERLAALRNGEDPQTVGRPPSTSR